MKWITLWVAILLASAGFAEEWNRFRGPNGQGIGAAVESPLTFDAKDFKWKTDLPGVGTSHPVISGKTLFVTSAAKDGTDRKVHGISVETGKVLWTTTYSANGYRAHAKNSFASGTPALGEKRLYVAFASESGAFVVALDHDGKKIWKKDLGPYRSQHGFGPSVMLYKDMVVMQAEQGTRRNPGAGYIVALSTDSGDEIWRSPIEAKGKAAYSTPCVARVKGEDVLLMTGLAYGLFGVNPKDGTILWSGKALDKRAVSSPVIAGDIMIGSSGSGGGGNVLAGVRMGGSGDVTASHVVYRMTKSAPYVPTPVVAEGRLYTVSDRGIGSCLDAASGKVLWTERIGGDHSASPIICGDRIYFVSEEGVVTVLQTGDRFKKIGGGELGARSFVTPAVGSGRLFFRTFDALICL